MKLVTVVGARPQFIKAAVVSRVLRGTPGTSEVLVHTGQHYDDNMNRVFFEEMDIPKPDYYLGLGSGTHGVQTGKMLEAIEGVLLAEKPDMVLVFGDTNSTLAGALAAVKLHILVAHVEAGLRSFNRRMPEEINRVLTDHASDLLFAPTQSAVTNLRREGILAERVHQVGDVMYDAVLYYGEKARRESRVMDRLGLEPREYILATIHRAENTDDTVRLGAIMEGLGEAAKEIPVVLPLHPRTRQAMQRNGLLFTEARDRLRLIEPVGYLDMLMLEQNARLIVTDSGGVQKEAFFCRVPCITLREETEWVELLEMGWNHLLSPTSAADVAAGIAMKFSSVVEAEGSPYGDGQAASKIVNCLLRH